MLYAGKNGRFSPVAPTYQEIHWKKGILPNDVWSVRTSFGHKNVSSFHPLSSSLCCCFWIASSHCLTQKDCEFHWMRIEVPSSEALLNPDHPCPTMTYGLVCLLNVACLHLPTPPWRSCYIKFCCRTCKSLRAQVRQVFWGHASAAVLPPPSKPPIEGLLSRVGWEYDIHMPKNRAHLKMLGLKWKINTFWGEVQLQPLQLGLMVRCLLSFPCLTGRSFSSWETSFHPPGRLELRG